MLKVTLWKSNWRIETYVVNDLQEAADLVFNHTHSKSAVKEVLLLENPKAWAVEYSNVWRVERVGYYINVVEK